MGGVILLLMITVVLCIVILCVRRCHRKRIPVDDKVFYNTTKLNTDVPVEYNPSYGVTKKDNNIIKTGNPVVSITTNPVYNVPAKPYMNINEDECDYAQTSQHSDLNESVKMYSNPSYKASMGKNKATPFSTNVTNSVTKTHHESCMTNCKQYNYSYVHIYNGSVQPHYNRATNATDSTEKDNIQIHANVDQSRDTKVSQYVINQLQSDDNATCDITASQQSDNLYI